LFGSPLGIFDSWLSSGVQSWCGAVAKSFIILFRLSRLGQRGLLFQV
jgi:hypothetical protein